MGPWSHTVPSLSDSKLQYFDVTAWSRHWPTLHASRTASALYHHVRPAALTWKGLSVRQQQQTRPTRTSVQPAMLGPSLHLHLHAQSRTHLIRRPSRRCPQSPEPGGLLTHTAAQPHSHTAAQRDGPGQLTLALYRRPAKSARRAGQWYNMDATARTSGSVGVAGVVRSQHHAVTHGGPATRCSASTSTSTTGHA
jgi:hypothetical protein